MTNTIPANTTLPTADATPQDETVNYPANKNVNNSKGFTALYDLQWAQTLNAATTDNSPTSFRPILIAGLFAFVFQFFLATGSLIKVGPPLTWILPIAFGIIIYIIAFKENKSKHAKIDHIKNQVTIKTQTALNQWLQETYNLTIPDNISRRWAEQVAVNEKPDENLLTNNTTSIPVNLVYDNTQSAYFLTGYPMVTTRKPSSSLLVSGLRKLFAI